MLHNILKKSIHFHQKTVFPYNSFHFFQVIYEVQNYKHFVPFCSNSTIIKKKGFSYFEAELTVNFKLYSDSYISKVTSEIQPGQFTIVSESDKISLFSCLKSTWNIQEINEKKCSVDYQIDFEFKNIIYQQVSQLFLDNVVKSMNTSFQERVGLLEKTDYFEKNQLDIQNNEKERNLNRSEQQMNFGQTQSDFLGKQIEEYLEQIWKENLIKKEELEQFLLIFSQKNQKELIKDAYCLYIIENQKLGLNQKSSCYKFINFMREKILFK